MKPYVLNKTISRLMQYYYLKVYVPSKFIWWKWVRSLTGYPRLTVPYANQGWISLDERDLLQRQIFVLGSYEEEVWNTLAEFVCGGEIIWDIGANIGCFAIQAVLDSRIMEIHCFEPHPTFSNILAWNMDLNQGKPFFVHKFGLSDENTETVLYDSPIANLGLASFDKDWGKGSLLVKCLTIDHVIQSGQAPSPHLIKLDVEGWEKKVLYGAKELLKNMPPRAIVFEAACSDTGELLDRELTLYLKEHGYQVSRIERPSGEIEERENYLAVLKIKCG